MYSWMTLYWSYCRSYKLSMIVIFRPRDKSVGLQIHICFCFEALSACRVYMSMNCFVSFGKQ